MIALGKKAVSAAFAVTLVTSMPVAAAELKLGPKPFSLSINEFFGGSQAGFVDDLKITFEGFDTSLGVLTGAALDVIGAYEGSFAFGGENQAPDQFLQMRGDFSGGVIVEAVVPVNQYVGSYSAVYFADGSCGVGFPDFCSGAGSTWDAPTFNIVVDPNRLNALINPLDVVMRLDGGASVSFESSFGAAVSGRINSSWSGDLFLTYFYDPFAPTSVPTPGSLALMIPGLFALAGFRFRRGTRI